MLGSYGLLGIFVYCEHKAGPPPPPAPLFFWVPVLLSVDHVKMSDVQTDQESQEEEEEEGDCGSREERRSSLPGSFHLHYPKHK